MPSDTYTTADVARITEVPLRKIISFIERGYVAPSIQDAAGHGSKRLWNHADLVRCLAVNHLQTNLSADFVRSLANDLADDELIAPEWVWVVELSDRVAGHDSPVIRRLSSFGDEAAEASTAGETPTRLVVDFSKIHALVTERL
jgi:DNA-binding transcriptional MerR regulator